MLKKFVLLLAMFQPLTSYAMDNERIDQMCRAIGIMAKIIVKDKNDGVTYKEAISKLKKYSKAAPKSIEIYTELIRQIYKEPFAMHLTEEGALGTYYADCLVSYNYNEES